MTGTAIDGNILRTAPAGTAGVKLSITAALCLILLFLPILSGCGPDKQENPNPPAHIDPPGSTGNAGDISPENRIAVDRLLREAEKLTYKKEYKEALACYDKVLEMEKDNIRALDGKSGIYLTLKDWDNLSVTVEKLLSADPDNANGLLLRAALRKEKGDMKGFLEDRTAARNAAPLTVRTNIELGRALSETGQFDEADKVLDRVLKMDPTKEELSALYTAKTYTALHKKQHNNAREYAEKVISMGKHKAHGYFLMMEICIDTDQKEKAFEMYQKYKKEDPEEELLKQQGPRMRAILYHSLGAISRNRFKYDDATVYYQKAQKLDQNNPSITLSLIVTLAEMGKTKQASLEAEKWQKMAKEPSDPEEMADHAVAYQMLNRTEKALSLMERAIKAEPDNSYLLATKAMISRYAGDKSAYEKDMARFNKKASPEEKAHVEKILKLSNKAGNKE